MTDKVWATPNPVMLTDRERQAVERLGEVWGDLCAIVGDGSTRDADLAEMAHHVHALQNAVLAQAAARAYPDLYRLAGAGPVQRVEVVVEPEADGPPPPEQEEPHEYEPQGPGEGAHDRSCVTCGGALCEEGTNHTNTPVVPEGRDRCVHCGAVVLLNRDGSRRRHKRGDTGQHPCVGSGLRPPRNNP